MKGIFDTSQVPRELWLRIFCELSLPDCLAASRVCRIWQETAQDRVLWSHQYASYFGSLPSHEEDPKLKACAAHQWVVRMERGGWRSTVLGPELSLAQTPRGVRPLRPLIFSKGRGEWDAVYPDDGVLIFLSGEGKGRRPRAELDTSQGILLSAFRRRPEDRLFLATSPTGSLSLYRAEGEMQQPVDTCEYRTRSTFCPQIIHGSESHLVVMDHVRTISLYEVGDNDRLVRRPIVNFRSSGRAAWQIALCRYEGRQILIVVDSASVILAYDLDTRSPDPIWTARTVRPRKRRLCSYQASPDRLGAADDKHQAYSPEAVTVIPDGSHSGCLICHTPDRQVCVLNPTTGACVLKFQDTCDRIVRSVQIVAAPDGEYALGINASQAAAWSLLTGERVWTYPHCGVGELLVIQGPRGPYALLTHEFLGSVEPHEKGAYPASKKMACSVVRMRLLRGGKFQPTLIGRSDEALVAALWAVRTQDGWESVLVRHVKSGVHGDQTDDVLWDFHVPKRGSLSGRIRGAWEAVRAFWDTK